MNPIDTLHVHPLPGGGHRGLLLAGSQVLACTLGRSVCRAKREGDGATPAGSFPLRALYYRPDRLPRPVSGLPVRPISRALGWSDDPADPRYNRPVALPRRFRHESMWRDDGLYDLVVVLGHNDAPVRRPLGSALFLHLMGEDRGPTAGCVALKRGDLWRLLPRLATSTRLVVA